MRARFTRRKFIKTFSAVSMVGISIIPDFRLFNSKTFVCNHCGIDTYTFSFPSDKRCACNSTYRKKQ